MHIHTYLTFLFPLSILSTNPRPPPRLSLSPFLFILAQQAFSHLLLQAAQTPVGPGITLARGAPRISHLMFADNTILFFKATENVSLEVARVLNTYTALSGQRINFQKSSILISPNTPPPTATYISTVLQTHQSFFQGWYLGIDLNFFQTKSQLFASLRHKFQKRLFSW